MILVVLRQGGWTALTVAQVLKLESKNDSRLPRDLLGKRHRDSLTKIRLTLSQGMLKNGNVVDDGDDEVRISASQNRVFRILPQDSVYTVYNYSLISAGRCGLGCRK